MYICPTLLAKLINVIGNMKRVQLETNLKRKSDPLKEYLDEEPMTPAKIITHDPTAVHRDPKDQHITTPGDTGVTSEKAMEQYRKHGMTKIDI